jgi:hypothetical protein
MAFLRTAPEGDETPAVGGSAVPPTNEPFAVFPTSEALEKRLKQATRSQLRELFGTEDLDLIRARQAKLIELETQEEERRKAQLTTEERLKAEKAEAERKALEAEDALAQERLERKIAQECATLGCKNVSYASFLILEKTRQLGDGEQIDIGQFLTESLVSEQHKAALGIATPVSRVADPANTVPIPQAPPPPPAPPGTPAPIVDSMAMSPTEWAAKKAQLGI